MYTVSPARAWRPAVAARLARTLGSTNCTFALRQFFALQCCGCAKHRVPITWFSGGIGSTACCSEAETRTQRTQPSEPKTFVAQGQCVSVLVLQLLEAPTESVNFKVNSGLCCCKTLQLRQLQGAQSKTKSCLPAKSHHAKIHPCTFKVKFSFQFTSAQASY
jgi:hypothetical protein